MSHKLLGAAKIPVLVLNFRRRFKRSRIKRIFLEHMPRFVIIAKLNGRRDVAQFGSAPALGAGCRRFESCRPDHMRVWFNGRTEAFQASNAGSIPVTRSNKTSDQSLIGSVFLFVHQNVRQAAGQMRTESERNFRPCCFGRCIPGPACSAAHQPLIARAILQKRSRVDQRF